MAEDIQSNIKINIDTSEALSSIKLLQAQISAFHTQMAKMGAASAATSANMQQNLLNSINASGKFAASITTIKTSAESFTTALEKNKLSLGEYFRYAGAASKSFGKFFSSEFDTINKVARERVKDLQTQYIKLGRDANGAMQAIKVRPLILDMENLGTKTQIAAQKQQLLNQLLKQGSTNLLNFGKNTQWAGRQLMVGFTVPLTMMGGAAVKAYQQMEEAAVKFKRVYGDMGTTNAQTEQMIKQVQALALEYTKYGIAVKDTMDMASQAAAMGKTGADLLQQIANANKLSALGGVDQNKALQTTISLTNAFGIASKDLSSNINFLNAVENQTVLNIEDMTTAIPKAAPVIKQLGGNVKDLAFFLTAMKEGGVNASEGANAIKSGLASIINPTNAAKNMLKGFGINLTEIVQKDKGNLRKTVIDFASALDHLDPLNRAQAIEKMFGKFQFARISTLFQNITQQGTQAAKVLDLANSSSVDLALLSQQELKKVQDSPLFQFKKAIADFQNSLAPIGQQFLQAITPIIKFGQSLLDGFNHLNSGVKSFIVQVVGIGGIIGPVLLMTFGLIANAVANVIKGFSLVKDLFNKTGKSSLSLGEQVNYMTSEQIQAAAVASSLEQVHSKLKQTFTAETAAINELTSAYERSVAAQRAFQGPIISEGGMKRKGYATGGIVRGPGTGTSDSIPAMLSAGEAVIPAKQTEKYSGLIHGMISGSLPRYVRGGFVMPPRMWQREIGPQTQAAAIASEKKAAALQAMHEEVLASKYAGMTPMRLPEQLVPSSGNSFITPRIGGIYQLENGQQVFIKPQPNLTSALAELRGTQIARDAHGLIAPQQTLRVILDPTDPLGKRTLFALESPLNDKIGNPSSSFTRKEYFKQLVASLLRGDKDLGPGNLGGNVLADVGPSGVFARATRNTEMTTAIPSMEQQAMINLLGVKGGAKKWFAQATSSIAKEMTPQEYTDAMLAEINDVLPKLRSTVDSFGLSSAEKPYYEAMISRLEQGMGVDWSRFQSIHAAVPGFARGGFIGRMFGRNPKMSQANTSGFNQDAYIQTKNGKISIGGFNSAEEQMMFMSLTGKNYEKMIKLSELDRVVYEKYAKKLLRYKNLTKERQDAILNEVNIKQMQRDGRLPANLDDPYWRGTGGYHGTSSFGLYATGGMISGPGTGTSDSILARVSNGEAIIPAKQARKYSGLISGMIAGNLPGFAKGFQSSDSINAGHYDFNGQAGSKFFEHLEGITKWNKELLDQGMTLTTLTEDERGFSEALQQTGLKLRDLFDATKTGGKLSGLFTEGLAHQGSTIGQTRSRNLAYNLSIFEKSGIHGAPSTAEDVVKHGQVASDYLEGVRNGTIKLSGKALERFKNVEDELQKMANEGNVMAKALANSAEAEQVRTRFIRDNVKTMLVSMIAEKEQARLTDELNANKEKLTRAEFARLKSVITETAVQNAQIKADEILLKEDQHLAGIKSQLSAEEFKQAQYYRYYGAAFVQSQQGGIRLAGTTDRNLNTAAREVARGGASMLDDRIEHHLSKPAAQRRRQIVSNQGLGRSDIIGKQGMWLQDNLNMLQQHGFAPVVGGISPIVNGFLQPIVTEIKKTEQGVITTAGELAAATKTEMTQAGIDAGQGLQDGVKNNLEIHSPSKKMEQLGEDAYQGLENGMTQGAKNAARRHRRVSSNGIITPRETVTQQPKRTGSRRAQTAGQSFSPGNMIIIQGSNITQTDNVEKAKPTPKVKEVPQEKAPLRQRFGGTVAKGVSKVAGMGMKAGIGGFAVSAGLSMLGGVGGPVGDVANQLSGFAMAISSITSILQFLPETLFAVEGGLMAGIAAFAAPVAIAVGAIALLAGGIYLAIKAEQDRIQKLKEATAGYTATLYGKTQADAAANIFGYTKRNMASSTAGIAKTEITTKGIQKQNTLDKIIATDDFKKNYTDIVSSVSKLSQKELNNSLYQIGIKNMAEGNSAEGAMALVQAIQKAAGRQDVNLTFKSLSLDNKDSQKQLEDSVGTMMDGFNKLQQQTSKSTYNYYDTATQSWKEYVNVTKTWSSDSLVQIKQYASNFKSIFQSLGTSVKENQMTIESYNTSFDAMLKTIEKSPNSYTLLQNILNKMTPEIQAVFKGMKKGTEDFNLVLKATMAGMTIDQGIIDALNYNLPGFGQEGKGTPYGEAQHAAALAKLKDEYSKYLTVQQEIAKIMEGTKTQEQKNLDIWNAKISNINAALDVLSRKEDKVNKAYDKRIKALDDIQKANDVINQQSQDQLDLADALSKGDIAAAARAQAKISQDAATAANDAAKANLEAGRQNALAALTVTDKTGKSYNRNALEGMLSIVQDLIDNQTLKGLNFTSYKKTGAATGGHITGPGNGTSDSIPAMLSNGEYVIRAGAVKTIGINTLDRLNQADKMKFAIGGYVGYKSGGYVPNEGGLPTNENLPADTSNFGFNSLNSWFIARPGAGLNTQGDQIFGYDFNKKTGRNEFRSAMDAYRYYSILIKNRRKLIPYIQDKFKSNLDDKWMLDEDARNLYKNNLIVNRTYGSINGLDQGEAKVFASAIKKVYGTKQLGKIWKQFGLDKNLLSNRSIKLDKETLLAMKNPEFYYQKDRPVLPANAPRFSYFANGGMIGYKNGGKPKPPRPIGLFGYKSPSWHELNKRRVPQSQMREAWMTEILRLENERFSLFKGLPEAGIPGPRSSLATSGEIRALDDYIRNALAAHLDANNWTKTSLQNLGIKDGIPQGYQAYRALGSEDIKLLSKLSVGSSFENKKFLSIAGSGDLERIGRAAQRGTTGGAGMNAYAVYNFKTKVPGIHKVNDFSLNVKGWNQEGLVVPGSKMTITGFDKKNRTVFIDVESAHYSKIDNASNSKIKATSGLKGNWGSVSGGGGFGGFIGNHGILPFETFAKGGLVPKYFANGGYARGGDVVPAMLTPGEFVVKKPAADRIGSSALNSLNNGISSAVGGDSVYNTYSINISVNSNSNAQDIANTVVNSIRRIDNQRIRSTRV